MDSYTFSLALGGAGLLAMAATGLSHSGTHAPGHASAPHSEHAAGSHEAGAPHGYQAAHSVSHNLAHTSAHAGGFKSAILALASPRLLFSLLVGFGLTGIVARPFLDGILLVLVALLGGIMFERVLVAPLWRLMFRFASNPAVTLESSLMGEAHAASGFDNNGQGLVAIEVDGQIVQCLGTLQADDLALGVRVRAGDVLRVEEVETARNRCIVSYVGRAGM
ncbi:MAG: hypothetical protein M3Z30_08685 [Gemmatimonadota bacterium]|nr:hypothetical protein [Gemmatimonadota bacterium]